MGVTVKPLIEGKLVEVSTPTTQYTATNGTTIIDKFTAANVHTAAVSMYVYLVKSGGAAGSAYVSVFKTLQANETYTFPEVVGHALAAGDFISAYATVASAITIRASGREIT